MRPIFVCGSIILGALAGCAPVSPIVSDFNGASVKIQRSTLTSDTLEQAKAKTQAEATRICQAGGKTRAEPASTRMLPGDSYIAEDLFLCLDR
ncbi:hypothetical protein SAMN04489859_10375 [Paracoccus alcaliphilus]|uniref:YecR-like lipoprotein n=1 Tax=Paracoccus alcaliphilus TaxID=34002 RepID=A0A1H8M745_9RHOB|nr:hypothetical protein [Paracoccus alcaliphilus]WCR16992.1 hypothetical protein JHW40_11340 [Paracoccus alcaliphilus]SEO13179.1 hypothetical protein SAMN04489859_10375 [Paracoccus alcaliphilus]